MNEIFASNANIIAMSTIWFSQFFGISTDEFLNALTGSTLAAITEFYKNKGIDFDIEKVKVEEEAMMFVYERIMGIGKLAALAAGLGMKPEDFQE